MLGISTNFVLIAEDVTQFFFFNLMCDRQFML